MTGAVLGRWSTTTGTTKAASWIPIPSMLPLAPGLAPGLAPDWTPDWLSLAFTGSSSTGCRWSASSGTSSPMTSAPRLRDPDLCASHHTTRTSTAASTTPREHAPDVAADRRPRGAARRRQRRCRELFPSGSRFNPSARSRRISQAARGAFDLRRTGEDRGHQPAGRARATAPVRPAGPPNSPRRSALFRARHDRALLEVSRDRDPRGCGGDGQRFAG